jgi:hypothetical protein
MCWSFAATSVNLMRDVISHPAHALAVWIRWISPAAGNRSNQRMLRGTRAKIRSQVANMCWYEVSDRLTINSTVRLTGSIYLVAAIQWSAYDRNAIQTLYSFTPKSAVVGKDHHKGTYLIEIGENNDVSGARNESAALGEHCTSTHKGKSGNNARLRSFLRLISSSQSLFVGIWARSLTERSPCR